MCWSLRITPGSFPDAKMKEIAFLIVDILKAEKAAWILHAAFSHSD